MESNFEDPINLGNPYELTIKNVALEIEKKLSKIKLMKLHIA